MTEKTAQFPNTQNADVIPAGIAYTFHFYRSEAKPVEQIETILKKDEVTADLEKMKPGFSRVDKYPGLVSAAFFLPYKEEIEVLREGAIRKLEVPLLEVARFIFLPGFVLVSGKSKAASAGLQIVTAFLNVSGQVVKPDQGKMIDIQERAGIIHSVKFKEIPHSEIERVTLSGELEEIYSVSSLPLRESEIVSLTGAFNTSDGIREITFGKNGNIKIAKSKRLPIRLNLLSWCIEQVL